MAETNSSTHIHDLPLEPLTRICYVCKTEKEHMSTCSKCRIILYCSQKCQRYDWEKHKLTCTPEVKQEGIRNKKTAKILIKNEPFMRIMSSICHLHWNPNKILVCSLVETGFLEWKCLIELYPLDKVGQTPTDQYSFAIFCLDENNNNFSTNIALPIEICKENCKKLFGSSKIRLPIKLTIGHDKVIATNAFGKVIKVIE